MRSERAFSGPGIPRITVRRSTIALAPRPTREPVDGDDVETLRREVRRLRGEVLRLEDDKRELERRLGFMQRQVEEPASEGAAGNVDVVDFAGSAGKYVKRKFTYRFR